MIEELRITKAKNTPIEWWAQVDALKRKKVIRFKPGLNVIIGPNGSGKSTVLKALGTLTHCRQGGLPKVTQTSLGEFRSKGYGDEETWSDGMKLVQDGQPVHYFDPSITPGLAGGGSHFDWDFASESMGLALGVNRISSGQGVLGKFSRVFEAAIKSFRDTPDAKVPYGHDVNPDRLNDYWVKKLEVATKSLEATCDRGQRTILLDEPARSLDLPNQVLLWTGLLRWRKIFQIIVASHSPLAMGVEGAHYIELKKGYRKECEDALRVIQGEGE